MGVDLDCVDLNADRFGIHCEIADGDRDPTVYLPDGPSSYGIEMLCSIALSIYDRSVTSLTDEKNGAVTGESDGSEMLMLSESIV